MKVVDLHCDTILEIWNSELKGDRLALRDTENSTHPLHIDLKKLKEGDYLLQNFALFVDLHMPSEHGKPNHSSISWKTPGAAASKKEAADSWVDPWLQVTEMIRVFREEMAANADLIRQVFTWNDIVENQRNGLISALLTTEEGGILQGKLDRLDTLYQTGVRMMTITWNYDNELGHPNPLPHRHIDEFLDSSTDKTANTGEEPFDWFFTFKPSDGNGLTSFGKQAVARMEELHILPDVSHLSDAGFFDVADIVKGPFVASHSNARALCGCRRNLTDDMIRTIAAHGGVAGLNFCPSFVMEASRESLCYSSCEALCRHARHLMDVGGREVVALGTDFDGIAPENLEIENASQIHKLADYMSCHGFSTEEIEGVFFKNALRVYREVL